MESVWMSRDDPSSWLDTLTALFPVLSRSSSDPAPSPNPSPNIGRGKQSAVGSSCAPVCPNQPRVPPLTEVAIPTSHSGLRKYVLDSTQPQQPACPDLALADEYSSKLGERELDFVHIDEDLDTVDRHLGQRGFHQLPRDNSISAPPFDLERELKEYIQEPTLGTTTSDTPQVRILILSGHNIMNKRLQIKMSTGMVCPWSSLRKSLAALPPNVITVIILDCCKAHGVLSLLTDDTHDTHDTDNVSTRELVLMAGAKYTIAEADRLRGSHFLFFLLEVLKSIGVSGTGLGSWEELFKLTMEELERGNSKQDPCWYINSSREPSYIFRHLAAPQQSEAKPTTNRGRQHSSVQVD